MKIFASSKRAFFRDKMYILLFDTMMRIGGVQCLSKFSFSFSLRRKREDKEKRKSRSKEHSISTRARGDSTVNENVGEQISKRSLLDIVRLDETVSARKVFEL